MTREPVWSVQRLSHCLEIDPPDSVAEARFAGQTTELL